MDIQNVQTSTSRLSLLIREQNHLKKIYQTFFKLIPGLELELEQLQFKLEKKIRI
jgi:hypothetical protein